LTFTSDKYRAVCKAVVPATLVLIFSASAQAIPKDQFFKGSDDSGADVQELGHQPMHNVQPSTSNSLNPNLTPFINEAHPFPDYINKFPGQEQLPKHYLELIRTLPVDKVQSKIFNIKDFKNARRIGVAGFENKTEAPFKDANAGYIVANQISLELQSYGRYQVIPPRKAKEDARIKIIKTPTSPKGPKSSGSEGMNDRSVASLPHSKEKVDAVMIGAVTRFTDSYVNRRGEIKKSISSGVEFGAFLVNAKTGEVIWGARYVGSQTPGIRSFLQGKTHWLSKEELSRSAMKKVLKAFHNAQNKNR
jgi:hypothetical protein